MIKKWVSTAKNFNSCYKIPDRIFFITPDPGSSFADIRRVTLKNRRKIGRFRDYSRKNSTLRIFGQPKRPLYRLSVRSSVVMYNHTTASAFGFSAAS